MSDSNLTLPTRTERQVRLERLLADLERIPNEPMSLSPAERALLAKVVREYLKKGTS